MPYSTLPLAPSLEISGRVSALTTLSSAFYKNYNCKNYLLGVENKVLDLRFGLIISENVDWVPDWVEVLVEVRLERVDNKSDFKVGVGSEDFS